MFDFVGKNKRLLQFFLALIIVPTFAFFGIQSYDTFSGTSQQVAEVAGEPITVYEYERALEQQRNRLREAFGGNIDPALFDTPEARRELLDTLIARRVLLDYAFRRNMAASDDQVREFIANYPAFLEDGHFSRERYEALLRAQNLSPVGFESQLRADIALDQLSTGVAESAFVSRAVAARFAIARAETREVSVSHLTAGEYIKGIEVTDGEIETYYAEHGQDFETPEQVRAAYVMLSREQLAEREKVSPEAVQQHYDERIAPQLKAREEARERAEAVLAEVRKDPSRFAELAQQHSEDPGSAAQGGDLGFFARGDMVKPFEDAVFKLKPGQISPVVTTDFGFHIIQLEDIRKDGQREERRARHILFSAPEAPQDAAAARKEIEEELKRQQLARKYPEAAENFSNMAYEQPDSLEPLAEAFDLQIQESGGWLSRSAGQPPLDNPRLLDALFSEDAIEGGQNTEAIEVEPGKLVVARVIEHKAASKRPLAKVRDEIRNTLRERKATERAQQAGAEALQALQTGKDGERHWAAARSVSRENPNGLDARALAAVFQADVQQLPAYVGIPTAAGYTLYRISAVNTPEEIDPARHQAAANALAQLNARQDFQAFIEGLRAEAGVEVNETQLLQVGRRGP